MAGAIINDKHGDLIKQLSDADDIDGARRDTNCSDIIIFCDLGEVVVREMFSSGNSEHRDKVKIVQFVSEDKTPDNTLEVEGYKVVQMVGSPDSADDIMTILNKAEYPVAKSYMIDGSLEENPEKSSLSSDPPMAHVPLHGSQDHSPVPVHPNPQSNNRILIDTLNNLVEVTQKSVKIQEENLSLSKDRNYHLGEIHGTLDAEKEQA